MKKFMAIVMLGTTLVGCANAGSGAIGGTASGAAAGALAGQVLGHDTKSTII